MLQPDTLLTYRSPVPTALAGLGVWVRLAVVTNRPDTRWPVYFEYSLN